MQNGARYQAVWEILSEVFKDRLPADKIINDYLRGRKYIGSKDRRFIVDLVWRIIRNRMKLEFDAQSADARQVLLYAVRDRLDEVFDGSVHGMASLTAEEEKRLRQDGFSGTASSIFSILQKIHKNPSRSYKEII